METPDTGSRGGVRTGFESRNCDENQLNKKENMIAVLMKEKLKYESKLCNLF